MTVEALSPYEAEMLRAFRLLDERIAAGVAPEQLRTFRQRLVGELVLDADVIAATLAPEFELLTRAGGTTTRTSREAFLTNLPRQGQTADAAMWVELDDLVVEDVLAGHGTLKTLRTSSSAAAHGVIDIGPDDLCVTAFPLAFFIRFAGDLMSSETLYMDIAATEVTVLRGVQMPSVAALCQLVEQQ